MYMHSHSSDRRRFQRLNMNLSVFYRVQSPLDLKIGTGDREFEATTLDISPAGMAFLSKYNLPEKSCLSMKLVLFQVRRDGMVDFNDPVEMTAQVRSCVSYAGGDYRVGVSFNEINTNSQEDESISGKLSLKSL
ncbi:MAG: PilZ domain-containing protein [Candidatus Omnitrophica bacterium]|jgi:c-di-GMP-binding flagellar brake protein YcgR|nr:PilZ domain-containing protein [Candidatus Omnitrophota bacterium]